MMAHYRKYPSFFVIYLGALFTAAEQQTEHEAQTSLYSCRTLYMKPRPRTIKLYHRRIAPFTALFSRSRRIGKCSTRSPVLHSLIPSEPMTRSYLNLFATQQFSPRSGMTQYTWAFMLMEGPASVRKLKELRRNRGYVFQKKLA